MDVKKKKKIISRPNTLVTIRFSTIILRYTLINLQFTEFDKFKVYRI